MKKIKKTGPSFWISPQEYLLESLTLKLLSKPHRRCSSGLISPYQHNIVKTSSCGKLSTRQHSPKLSQLKKASKPKLSRKSNLKKPAKKFGKKKVVQVKLAQLKGNVKIKAPKIYKNQIFRDVYDEVGNHDRVMETVDISLSLPEIVNEEEIADEDRVLFKNIEKSLERFDVDYKGLKNPGSSFFQETKPSQGIDHNDLFHKLQLIE